VGPCVDPSGCQEWQLKAAIEAMSPARRDYQFEARDGKKWAPFENPPTVRRNPHARRCA